MFMHEAAMIVNVVKKSIIPALISCCCMVFVSIPAQPQQPPTRKLHFVTFYTLVYTYVCRECLCLRQGR